MKRMVVITDFTFQQKHSHTELAMMAIQGGADSIQFRQKHGSLRDLLASAHAVQLVCSSNNIPFIVNDRVDIAQAVHADGVHLGQVDMPASLARAILGPDFIIGITTPDSSLASKAFSDGADYVGFGPVYPTKSKSNPIGVQGIEGLAKFCNTAKLPVIAIAGITAERSVEVMKAGAYGVAVMTAVSLAKNPTMEVQRFSEVVCRQ